MMNVTFRKVLVGGLKFVRQTVWKEAVRAKEPTNPRRFLQNKNVTQQLWISPASQFWKSFLGKPPSIARVNCVWETLLLRLRKEAVNRLLSPLNRGIKLSPAHRSGRRPTYVPYLAFGFVGLVLSDKDDTLSPTHSSNDESGFDRFCSSVRKQTEGELNVRLDSGENITYPKKIRGYDIEEKPIAKGSYGEVYPARISQCHTRDVSVFAPDDVTSSGNTEQTDLPGDDVSVSSFGNSCESKEWEFITQEEMQMDLSTNTECTDLIYSAESGSLSDGSQPLSQVGCSENESPFQNEPKEITVSLCKARKETKQPSFEGEFNLAIKIMFNGSIPSNSAAIEAAFKMEKILLSDNLHPKGGTKNVRSHPNIVKIHQAFVDDNIFLPPVPSDRGCNKRMYLVMPRYEMTLHQYMETHGCSDEWMAKLMLCQLLEGAAYLNSLNIAHRDLKSNNILVEIDCHGVPGLVITDFGCCLFRDQGLPLKLSWYSGEIVGNRALTAPEIKAAFKNCWIYADLDYSKSDGWALGAIAYEICGMENPFYQRGVDSATYDEKSLPPFPNFVSPAFEFVMMGLLKKDPRERLTCVEAADMLHLQLWKQNCWMKGPETLRKLSYLKQTLHGWLHELVHPGYGTVMEESSPVTADLQVTFLSRINSEGLLLAATKLIYYSWRRWLQDEVIALGFNVNDL